MRESTRVLMARVGVDLAKSVIQVHGVDASGRHVVARTLKRDQFLAWCAQLPAVRAHEVGRDEPRIQSERAQLARPVMPARARLHRDHTARRQLRAPSQKLIALEGAGDNASARTKG